MSLRELYWMADGRLEVTWQQTSWIVAAVLNSAFGCRTARQPHEINPHRRAQLARDERAAHHHRMAWCAMFGFNRDPYQPPHHEDA